MNANFARLWEQTMARISGELARALPPLIVALAILAAAYLLARLAHWVLLHNFRGRSFDRFLRQSGLGSFLWRPGRWRAAQLVAGTVQAALLVGGALAALSVFDTSITTRMVDAVLLMLPKLLIASGLLLAGAWLVVRPTSWTWIRADGLRAYSDGTALALATALISGVAMTIAGGRFATEPLVPWLVAGDDGKEGLDGDRPARFDTAAVTAVALMGLVAAALVRSARL